MSPFSYVLVWCPFRVSTSVGSVVASRYSTWMYPPVMPKEAGMSNWSTDLIPHALGDKFEWYANAFHCEPSSFRVTSFPMSVLVLVRVAAEVDVVIRIVFAEIVLSNKGQYRFRGMSYKVYSVSNHFLIGGV